MKTFHVRYINKTWQLIETGTSISEQKFTTKKEAVKAAVYACYNAATEKEPISLRICTKDGQIKQEWTYPRSADPRRSKG